MNIPAFNAALTTLQQAGNIAAGVNLTALSTALTPLIITAEQTVAQNASDQLKNNAIPYGAQNYQKVNVGY